MPSRRILYVVTEDWFFLSHFRFMAEAARDAGYRVTVAARAGEAAQRVRALGFDFIPIDVARSETGPMAIARNTRALAATVRKIGPDIVHLVALRPILLGAIACRSVPGAKIVAAPTGLGYAWSNGGPKAAVLRRAVRAAVASIRRRGGGFIFENDCDAAEFGLVPAREGTVIVVPGAGVGRDEFAASAMPAEGPLKVVVIARMLNAKGIVTAADAIARARALGADVTLDIYGIPDPENPDTLAISDLEALGARPGIRWHGRTTDVAGVLAGAHISMLLTRYREGLPRTLIEAAAAGRALIATDMPGCRDIVHSGRNGFLVPVSDAADAAAAHLVALAADRPRLAEMGAASRELFLERFTREHVCRAVVALYDRLTADRA